MDKIRIIIQKCLVNELVLSFGALKKCAKTQSNLMIPSEVIVLKGTNNDINDDRPKETVVKTFKVSQNVEIL